MLFSSLEFLYLFLPLSLAVYFLCPQRWRNAVLLLVSLIFYGLGEPMYLPLMLLTVAADYGFGLLLSRRMRKNRSHRWVLILAVVFNLSLLAFFKYYDLIAPLVFLPELGLSLPIGISFYTFQALSYVIDVYRRETEAQRSFVDFGTYVSLFPQLIAGPIVRYTEIDEQLKERTHTLSRISSGVTVFLAGLCKKVLLANPAGALGESLLAGAGIETVAGVWLWLISYAFQIYFDFSGYSDMAIGLGRILGFEFPQNFRYPYVSRSITEFWRRWHITLSSWFRSYVYIPLGGNRRGRWRTYRNLLITWALTGLWHGAAWNFLLWGLYFFLLLALEKAFLLRAAERLPSVLRWGGTLFLILAGWLIFASDSLGDVSGLVLFGRLFGVGVNGVFSGLTVYEAVRNLPLLAVMAVGCTPLPKRLYERLCRTRPRMATAARIVLCPIALLLCTAYLVDSGYNPFLYFRF
ncbi:MAG: MBOAT family protein [Ruminococcaceae bacterium]|nr:MBOAT family protein [Oscillospiraceae bacterium]